VFKRLVGIAISILAAATVSQAASVPGRIAVSADGNKHDCDDLFATAVSVAILAQTGNASKLRYYGHSDHIWGTEGGCRGDNREIEMERSSRGTAQLWGGFDTDVFINAKQETQEAVDRLAALINESSEGDPLWIVAAGPMDVVGRAIAKSSADKRQHVTLISHSNWNNEHSDKPESGESHSGWTWNEIKNDISPTVKQVKITDQNPGLNTTYSTYHPWRDSSDEKIRWLWDRGQVTGISWPDCSDSGMVYWLVMGRGSDDELTPDELLDLFATPPPPPPPPAPDEPLQPPVLLDVEPLGP
jgi:hypothetical protein